MAPKKRDLELIELMNRVDELRQDAKLRQEMHERAIAAKDREIASWRRKAVLLDIIVKAVLNYEGTQ